MTDPQPAKADPTTAAAKAAPAKAAAAKPAAAKSPVTKTPVAKTPVAKTSVAKTPVAETPVAKTPVARTTAPKTTAAKTPAAAAPAAKAPVAKTVAPKAPAPKTAAVTVPAAKAPAATAAPATRAKAPTKTPVVAPAPVAPPVPVIAPAVPVAAAAPAGWYQVTPGSPQQRYWDGAAWTEHFHPATVQAPVAQTQAAAVHPGHLKAPEGTNPSTIWFWLTAVSLIIGIVGWFFTGAYLTQLAGISGNYSTEIGVVNSGPAYILSTVLGFVEIVAYILFPVFDWLALRKRGVPKPFHWAWSLFAIVLSSPIVYVIGRTVVVKRRTGKGLAPLWVFIALQVVTWIVALVVIVIFIAALATQFGNLLSDAGNVL